MTVKVIVGCRLFEPIKSLIIEGMTSAQSIAERQPLIEVDHQLDLGSSRFANGVDRLHILGQFFAPQSHLQRLESAFADKLASLIRQREDIAQPKTVAVVGGHGVDSAP